MTTDCSTTKQLATGVAYFDQEKGVPVGAFFDLLEPTGGTAREISECLQNSFKSRGVPIENLTSCCADTCNTNFGSENSVTVHLKHLLPHLLAVKCACHLMNMVSRKSFEKIPKEIDNMLHRFAKRFGKSHKQVGEFRKLQELMGVEIH